MSTVLLTWTDAFDLTNGLFSDDLGLMRPQGIEYNQFLSVEEFN
jgi:hypothetical protein